jgi:hypothetical protein
MEMKQETGKQRGDGFLTDDEMALREDIFFWFLE